MAEEEVIKKKNVERGYIKSSITRLSKFSKSDLSNTSREELLLKKQQLSNKFSEYEDICKELLYLNPADEENVELVETTFYATMSAFDKALTSKPATSSAQCTAKKLPPINIQNFSDTFTARAYQLERDQDEDPTLEEFLKYLERRAVALENTEGRTTQQASAVYKSKLAANVVQPGAPPPCGYCKYTDHKLYACKKFQMLPPADRLDFIKNNKICIICISKHSGKCKFHFRCSLCKGPHNSILHCEEKAPESAVHTVTAPTVLAGNTDNNVLLPTARIKIIGKDGKEHHVRAFIDGGSQASLVTSDLVQRLGMTPQPKNMDIIGIGNTKVKVKACIPLEIHSLKSPFKTTINCDIMDDITCYLPQNKIDVSGIQIPEDVVLADEMWSETGEIHMLISSNVFFQAILPSKKITMPLSSKPTTSTARPQPAKPASVGSTSQHCLHLINTEFGYIIGGNIPNYLSQPASYKVVLKCELAPLNNVISQFWNTEKVPEIFGEQSSEQDLCEQIFKDTVKLQDNKFQVALPLKLPLSEVNETLGNSFHFAYKRFLNLEKKLHANPNLFNLYRNFINEYLQLNHGHYVDIELYMFWGGWGLPPSGPPRATSSQYVLAAEDPKSGGRP
ncbi:putative peptidase (DUF1758) domain-containing protein [Phthorimaea operculella]|nr:putative peptidase (DUF1758) domain-containing protein [Phthorimaea operculella]